MADDADGLSASIDGIAISSLKVVELRKELDKRNLSKYGKKDELAERLRKHVLKTESHVVGEAGDNDSESSNENEAEKSKSVDSSQSSEQDRDSTSQEDNEKIEENSRNVPEMNDSITEAHNKVIQSITEVKVDEGETEEKIIEPSIENNLDSSASNGSEEISSKEEESDKGGDSSPQKESDALPRGDTPASLNVSSTKYSSDSIERSLSAPDGDDELDKLDYNEEMSGTSDSGGKSGSDEEDLNEIREKALESQNKIRRQKAMEESNKNVGNVADRSDLQEAQKSSSDRLEERTARSSNSKLQEGEPDSADIKPLEDAVLKPRVPRKRKWGKPATSSSGLSISTDSLKNLIPNVTKILPPDETESPTELPSEEQSHLSKIKRTINQDGKVEESGIKVKIVTDKNAECSENKARRDVSPAVHPVSKIIHISHLVRPFTVRQLRELLLQTGNLTEDSLWLNKIKSHAFAKYETEEQATATRQTLHKCKWPASNPKLLVVDYGSAEALEMFKIKDSGAIYPSTGKAVPLMVTTEKEVAVDRSIVAHTKERETTARVVTHKEARQEKTDEDWDRNSQPIREWDKDKLRQSPPSKKLDRGREEEINRRRIERAKRHGSPLPAPSNKHGHGRERHQEEQPARLLDDLFCKTKVSPCIYWLPLTEEQATEKAAQKLIETDRRNRERVERRRVTDETRRRNRYVSPRRRY